MVSQEEVNAEFSFCDRSVPSLGLTNDASYPYRVYALQCKNDCIYVGISSRQEIKRRIAGHFSGAARCHYTEKNKPTSVLLVWPVVSLAAEAYVYYAFLSRMPAQRLNDLGGWVQTSSRMSPLASMVHEESRRQLRGLCFNCGSNQHYARACKAPLHGRTYKCPEAGCGASILVSSRGQSEVQPPPPPPQTAVPKAIAAPKAIAVMPANIASSENSRVKRRKLSERGGREVLIMGERYTALSWFLNVANPTPKHVKLARGACAAHAIELKGVHVRNLDQSGFVAVPPATPRSLSGSRRRLGCDFVNADLDGALIRRPLDGRLRCRLSQVLFRVSDLQAASLQ